MGARIAQSVVRLASDYLIHIPVQVRIPLAEASKNYKLLKNLFKSSCTGVYQWFDCHLSGAVVSQDISRPNAENCSGFPPPLDSRRLRSRIA